MLSNPTLDPETPIATTSEQPASNGESATEKREPSADASAGDAVTPGAGPVLPVPIADSPTPGLDAQIQKLKSEAPDIGVLGVTHKLSDDKYIRLLTYEEVVAMANTSWFEAGRALTRIRDEELWRGNYPGFDEYCAARWQFGRSKAHYLIGAASVCDTLRSVPGLPEPEFESQLRALVRLEPQKRIEAWQRAAGRAGPRRITAALVQAAAKAVQPTARPHGEQAERRRENLERRRQLRQLMSGLLELIMARRPYEELIQKAAALDTQVRFFFPPPRKR